MTGTKKCKAMQTLFTNEFIAHYGLPLLTINDWYLETKEKYFEIEDTHTLEILLHTKRGQGMAKFKNTDALYFTIINYDKFITTIPNESFKKGRQRCDIILCSSSDRYFLLGELKDRKPKSKVRSSAKNQLLSSLQTINAVPEIKSLIKQKSIRRCCYFNKQSISHTSLIATKAFNRLTTIYPDGFRMSKPDIESFGFDFYEYTGEQTMVLTK
jgi:hypothetical protein